MKKLFVALMLSMFAMGIANAGDIDQKLVALSTMMPGREFKLLVIPLADNFISNKMIAGSLKSGVDSQSSELIARMLRGPNALRLAITSDNDAVGAATLERALKFVKGTSSGVHEVAFIGDKEYEAVLTNMASETGVKFTFVPYP